jgi:heat shock protein HslJ
MKLSTRVFAILSITLLLCHCARKGISLVENVPPLIPTTPTLVIDNQLIGQWILEEIKEDKTKVRPATFIKIMNTGYHLYAGCNNINGALTSAKNNVTFSEVSITTMACDGMQYEQQLQELLLRTSTYKLSSNQLYLKTKDGASMVWKKVVPNEQLVGKKLKVIGITMNGGVHTSVTAPVQSLNFQSGGNLTGSAGCNYVNSTYEISGDLLHIGKVMTSKMACEDKEKQDYEMALIRHLSNTPLTIENNSTFITLRDKSGAIAIQLAQE